MCIKSTLPYTTKSPKDDHQWQYGEPLDAATKAQLRQTGLTAFKQSIGGSQGTFEQTKEMLDSFKFIYEANPNVFMHVNTANELTETQAVNSCN